MTARHSLRAFVARIPVVGWFARFVANGGRSPLEVEVAALRSRLDEVNHIARFDHDAVTGLRDQVASLDAYLPAVLNAIASSSGSSRRLARRTDALAEEIDTFRLRLERYDGSGAATTDELRADVVSTHDRLRDLEGEVSRHVQSQAWLIQRLEMVRAELMFELRYSQPERNRVAAPAERRVVSQRAVDDALAAGDLRLNLGCGHLPMEGYINVDMRELPGVDVIAPADDLPFEPGTVTELFSAHFLEHFPEEELKRRLLPAWVGLIADGGAFRAVVPDFEEMVRSWEDGKVPFPILRSVLFGGQEYEGDFHFTMFTPDSMSELLTTAGLVDVDVVERGRPNGDCLEMEIVARKPSPA